MKKYQKRMVKEYKDLLKKIDKLDRYLSKNILSVEDYRLMRAQYFCMCAYEGLLRERIERLDVKL